MINSIDTKLKFPSNRPESINSMYLDDFKSKIRLVSLLQTKRVICLRKQTTFAENDWPLAKLRNLTIYQENKIENNHTFRTLKQSNKSFLYQILVL